MIIKVKINVVEGDILEINDISEPLYLYSHGTLIKLTPEEYNILNGIEKEKRTSSLFSYRYNGVVL